MMNCGNYTLILQTSGYDGKHDISVDNRTEEVVNESIMFGNPDRELYTLTQAKTMLHTDAPDVLVRALTNPAVDDTYAVYIFSIEDPFIDLDPIRDHFVGETVTVSGRTNIPAGENLDISIARGLFDYGEPGDIVRQWRFVEIQQGIETNFFLQISIRA